MCKYMQTARFVAGLLSHMKIVLCLLFLVHIALHLVEMGFVVSIAGCTAGKSLRGAQDPPEGRSFMSCVVTVLDMCIIYIYIYIYNGEAGVPVSP